jgi:hypothetical protein
VRGLRISIDRPVKSKNLKSGESKGTLGYEFSIRLTRHCSLRSLETLDIPIESIIAGEAVIHPDTELRSRSPHRLRLFESIFILSLSKRSRG